MTKCEQLDEALIEHRRLAENHAGVPTYHRTTLRLADAAFATANYVPAHRLYANVLITSPNDLDAAKAWAGIGWVFFQRSQWQASRDAFAQIVNGDSDTPLTSEATLMLATAEENAGQTTAALDDYYRVIDHYDGSHNAMKALFAAVGLHRSRGETREAVILAERLINEYPEFGQLDSVLYQLAWDLNDVGENDAADQIFVRLYKLHRTSPFWADAAYRMAEQAARENDAETAFQLLDDLISSNVKEETLVYGLFLKGQLAANAQQWLVVRDTMIQIVRQFPENQTANPCPVLVS